MGSEHVIGLFILGSIVVWGGLSIAAGKIASNNGRNPTGWVLLSLFLSPFLVILLLLLLGESTSKAVRETAQRKPREVVKVRCANCSSIVKESASYCPECGRELHAARA